MSATKIIGILLLLFGAFNVVSAPFSVGADKVVYYLIIGVVMAVAGIWFIKKK